MTPPDPALELLAEALKAADPGGNVYHVPAVVARVAATEPGTRLLAALRSGLAVEAADDLLTYDQNAAAILDALPSFLDDVRAFMDSPEKKRSPGSAAHRRERLTVSLVWMGKRVEAMLHGGQRLDPRPPGMYGRSGANSTNVAPSRNNLPSESRGPRA